MFELLESVRPSDPCFDGVPYLDPDLAPAGAVHGDAIAID